MLTVTVRVAKHLYCSLDRAIEIRKYIDSRTQESWGTLLDEDFDALLKSMMPTEEELTEFLLANNLPRYSR